ncbi:hypothetical protein gpAD87_06560 [Paenibacillus sp. AD87]|nr:hypothetical protein gpAD87_06560 [Paenibacillus sp. AD87]
MSYGYPFEGDPIGHGRSMLLMEYNRFTDKTDRIGFIFLCGELRCENFFVSHLAFKPFNFKLDNGKINEL